VIAPESSKMAKQPAGAIFIHNTMMKSNVMQLNVEVTD
jgi:hypothetical protein